MLRFAPHGGGKKRLFPKEVAQSISDAVVEDRDASRLQV
jgi:hypothetical protein